MNTWGTYWDLFALRLVQLLGVTGGSRVLDVGTGGGSTLIAALKSIGPTGYVLSLDKEKHWADYANSELKRLNIRNAEVRHMDAKELDLPDGTFDFAVSGFLGWGYCFDFTKMEFRAPDLVMKEIHRTLRIGGKVGISTWLFQEDTEWMEHFVESFGYLARRVYSKESEDAWQMIMENSSFTDFMILSEKVEYEYESPEAWWNQMMDYGWKRQIENLSKEKEIPLVNIKLKAFKELKRHQSSKGVVFVRKVLFILGTKT